MCEYAGEVRSIDVEKQLETYPRNMLALQSVIGVGEIGRTYPGSALHLLQLLLIHV